MAAAGPGSSPSRGHGLPPMAPRVVLRQAQGATSAIETVPATGSVQRTWQAAQPASATSEPGTATSSVLSGHRRGTSEAIEEGPPRPTSTPAGVDLDRLIEAIEERVLGEIERRGGRYTGLF